MSHGNWINPLGFWVSSMVPEASDYWKWDIAQAKALNGDAGGTWSPTSPIGIGGSGLAITSSSGAATIAGGASTYRGGRLVLGANDFVALSPARTRTLVLPLTWMQLMTSASGRGADAVASLSVAPNPVGIVPAAYSMLSFVIPPRFLHQGATFLGASLSFHSSPSGSQGVSFSIASALPDGSTTQGWTPQSATTWTASHAYALNSYVVPTSIVQTGFYYKATSVSGTGTSGSTQPTWPTTIGATVTDNPGANQIVWTCIGTNGTLSAATIQNINAYSFEVTTCSLLPDGPVGINQAYVYQLNVIADGGTILHALTMNFSNITTTAFE